MQKKNNLLNGLLLVLIFVVVAVMMYLSFTGTIDLATGIFIMLVSAIALAYVLYWINTKNNPYYRRSKNN